MTEASTHALPPGPSRIWTIAVIGAAVLLLGLRAPSWVALAAGVALALSSRVPPPAALKTWTTRALQAGVVVLGASMHLDTVVSLGLSGAALTAASLVLALVAAAIVGRLLRVPRNTSLLLGVGTAICGGSAIAAVASVLKPKAHEVSAALAVVFVLNAIGLLIFPPIGHALGLDEVHFGRWAALAIHDTSSVVGAGLAYGPIAVNVATSTKLARALWIVPVTLVVAVRQGRETKGLRGVKWPWFILGFVAAAAVFTWVPGLAFVRPWAALVGGRLLVLAIFFIGLSLSREGLRQVGWRPFAQGVVLWVALAAAALPISAFG